MNIVLFVILFISGAYALLLAIDWLLKVLSDRHRQKNVKQVTDYTLENFFRPTKGTPL